MSMQYKSGFCQACGEQRKVERQKINHILHLLLSIITFGLWLIVWLGISVRVGGWRCEKCASTKVKNVH
jgi:hypothetical protein